MYSSNFVCNIVSPCKAPSVSVMPFSPVVSRFSLIDVLETSASITEFLSGSDCLCLERACRGIKLDFPSVSLEPDASLRLLYFLISLKQPSPVIEKRLRRTSIQIYTSERFSHALNLVSRSSLAMLKSIEIIEKRVDPDNDIRSARILNQAKNDGVYVFSSFEYGNLSFQTA
jgi:hypothetical protein